MVFIGIKGTVLALDRATGQEVWRSKLKGASFVNVILDGGSRCRHRRRLVGMLAIDSTVGC